MTAEHRLGLGVSSLVVLGVIGFTAWLSDSEDSLPFLALAHVCIDLFALYIGCELCEHKNLTLGMLLFFSACITAALVCFLIIVA